MNPIQQLLHRRLQEQQQWAKTHAKVMQRYEEHQERILKIRLEGYRKLQKILAKAD